MCQALRITTYKTRRMDTYCMGDQEIFTLNVPLPDGKETSLSFGTMGEAERVKGLVENISLENRTFQNIDKLG